MKRFASLFCAAAIALSLGACNKNRKSGEYAGVDGDFITGTPLPERIEGANFLGANVSRGEYAPVYFNYDSFEVSGAEQGKVDALAKAMKDWPNSIIIAGFTDSRGTDEYNRGLGERRAQAVRQSLIAAGVDGARVQTVSFGKEMPADPAETEAAYAKNRRAEFGVVK
ncbi:MAG TPA: OmpA family protein [Chthoniobacterales bacterium]